MFNFQSLVSGNPSVRRSRRPLRLVNFAGPGDVIGTWHHWKRGEDDPSQVAMTYSGQFFDVCRQLGAEGYCVSYHPRRGRVRDGQFRIEHRPIPFLKARAPLYHLGQLWSAFRVIGTCVRFRADVVTIWDGTCHWFPLRVLPWFGVTVVPVFLCVPSRKNAPPPGRLGRIIRRLNVPFFCGTAGVILSMSREITRQLVEVTQGHNRPIQEFLPSYRPDTFEDVGPPPESRSPFRVLFAGRIERFKGVFDLLDIARTLRADGHTDVEIDVCGAGSSLDELKAQVEAAGLTGTFRCHGHCTRSVMRQMLRGCHVVIVPTTTDFAEGFNQVVVESVLAGRPVITSSVCPALEYVQGAVVEVPPNNVAAYRGAILRLRDDLGLYQSLLRGCEPLRAQFYDLSKGWGAALLNGVRPAPVAAGRGEAEASGGIGLDAVGTSDSPGTAAHIGAGRPAGVPITPPR